MYAEKLSRLRKEHNVPKQNGATYSAGITKEKLGEMIKGFCRPEDAIGIRHEELYKVFDEYCKENGYPIINRQTLGRAFTHTLGLCRKKAIIDGKLCWVYVLSSIKKDGADS